MSRSGGLPIGSGGTSHVTTGASLRGSADTAPQHSVESRFEPSSEERDLQEGVAEINTGFGLGCAQTREPKRNAPRSPENHRLRFLLPPSNRNAERGADGNG